MESAELVDRPRAGRSTALWVGGLAASVAVLVQGYLALCLIYVSPAATWRTCLGIALGLAAPAAGVFAISRGESADESPRRKVARFELVAGLVSVILVIPTLVLVIVLLVVDGSIF